METKKINKKIYPKIKHLDLVIKILGNRSVKQFFTCSAGGFNHFDTVCRCFSATGRTYGIRTDMPESKKILGKLPFIHDCKTENDAKTFYMQSVKKFGNDLLFIVTDNIPRSKTKASWNLILADDKCSYIVEWMLTDKAQREMDNSSPDIMKRAGWGTPGYTLWNNAVAKSFHYNSFGHLGLTRDHFDALISNQVQELAGSTDINGRAWFW